MGFHWLLIIAVITGAAGFDHHFPRLAVLKVWRRGTESNQRRKVLQALKWRVLRIDDWHAFHSGNLAEDLVGSHQAFGRAVAMQAQRDGELKRIERA
jgi:hypothetical protein